MKAILVSSLINSIDMSIINFSNTRQMEGLLDEISPVKELMENKINLSRIVDREKRVSLTLNKVMRICFIVGLSIPVGPALPRDLPQIHVILNGRAVEEQAISVFVVSLPTEKSNTYS